MSTQDKQALLDKLTAQLSTASSPPFLFIGSGFSQRYLDLPSWPKLLEIFCEHIRPYKYYLSKSNGHLPTVASNMAVDFFEYAWSDKTASEILKQEDIKSKEDVLKYFICRYISKKSKLKAHDMNFPEEVQKLEKLSVDAIITTNWDCYLENIFPDYITYVGQDEVVVSNPHGIGEIYKIHGSIKRPSSLVLTDDDYMAFNSKYAYLAAKLITYLIEHPIIFVGYSLQDENIKRIIESLATCLGNSVQDRLRNNLILVQRTGEGRNVGIETTQVKVQNHHVPMTTVTTDDFGIIYDAIGSTKRKIPVRVLRFLKEEIYNIVKSSKPKGKIFVTDIDELGKHSDVEFVVGVGVKDIHDQGLEFQASKIGYSLPQIEKILEDVLESDDDKSVFGNVKELLIGTIPYHLSRSANTPIFKYLGLAGVTSDSEYQKSEYDFARAYDKRYSKYRNRNQGLKQAVEGLSLSDIIEDNTPQKAAMLIPHLEPQDVDLDELIAFLTAHKSEWSDPEATYHSAFRKLVAIYDRLKFGWID